MPLSSYAVMFGSSKTKAQRVLQEIGHLQVGEVVTEHNKNVTVTNRRMFREWQTREGNKHRQSKHRAAQSVLVAEECNGNVTNSIKNASSSSKKENTKKEGKKKTKSPVAVRIPDDFPLTTEMRMWAAATLPDLRLEAAHDRFVEYWTNNTTAKAEKVNWMLTWQNGMKLALKWQIENDSKKSVGKSVYIEPEYRCRECFDTKSIWIEKPADQQAFTGDMEERPCPKCAIAA